MTITARNIGRINVWPTYDVAREADTAECKFIGQLTVWRTADEARANITHEEGGGGAPEWVPANAVIHIDLVGGDPQGRAWVEGTGEVAVDTLLGEDPATLDGWGIETEYDPAKLLADGYGFGSVALLGSARSLLLAGTTLVCRHCNLGTPSTLEINTVSAMGDAAVVVELSFSSSDVSIYSLSGDAFILLSNALVIVSFQKKNNNIAFTLVNDRVDAAANGSTAETAALLSADRPAEYPFSMGFITTGNSNRLQSITLYDPLPSTAGLSELSEI